MFTKKSPAFTLIELLIVVAIIAILAAIAVPNFLEAQTRARIARVRSDERTMGVAASSYMVDNNGTPPPGQNDYSGNNYAVTNPQAQTHLTTPIAYIATIPLDTFFDNGNVTAANSNRPNYVFMAFRDSMAGDYLIDFQKGYRFGIQSKGPSRDQPYKSYGMHQILSRDDGFNAVYDPTNGTVSTGALIRTDKGEFNGISGQ